MRRRGLTLVELLTVIGLIALLAGLIFPVVAKARARARLVQCASQLQQIGLALRLYAADWNGFAPPYSPSLDVNCHNVEGQIFIVPTPYYKGEPRQGARLVAALKPYLKSKELWICPNDSWGWWCFHTSYHIPVRYGVMAIPLDAPPELLPVDLLIPFWDFSDPVAEKRFKCPLCRALVRDFKRWVYAFCHEHDDSLYLLVNGRVRLLKQGISFSHSCPAPVPKDWPFGNMPSGGMKDARTQRYDFS